MADYFRGRRGPDAPYGKPVIQSDNIPIWTDV